MDSEHSGKGIARTISRYQYETEIDIKYGEKTWRPVQSVIDVIQNHLDANTTAYEKGLLASVGITEYDPQNPQQQRTVSLLNRIKYSSESEAIQSAYADLSGIVDAVPQQQTLREELEGIDYVVPNMRLKVTRGTESKFVEYDQIRDLTEEWEVVGFRIDDQGTGFDARLLGMMGASTKKKSTSKRGGLGEGLKMSITHLARSGAKIRVASHNDDHLWIARPHIEDGTVAFKGIQREETDPHPTGSLTDVDFSSPDFDSDLRTEIIQTLDPRKGEGLGKYVLEFRESNFVPLISDPSELTRHGVPGGRVYVKGLLVEETDNLLFSYNLSEKWAIAGRDRKTVQQQLLEQNVKQALQSLTNREQVDEVVSKLKERNNFVEIKSISGSLQLTDEQQEVWRQAVQEAFSFEPGDAIFASDTLSEEQYRFATGKGYNVIRLPVGNANAIDLIKNLYPNIVVSFKDLEGEGESEASKSGEVRAHIPFVAEAEEATLPAEIQEMLGGHKDRFVQILASNLIQQQGRDEDPGYFNLHAFDAVTFAPAREAMEFENDASFYYEPSKNILYVKEGINPADFESIADMYVQLLKVPTLKKVFSAESQAIVTGMAGEIVIAMRPEMLQDFQLENNGQTKRERPVTYTQEQRETDERIIAYFQKHDELQRPGITFEALVEGLAELQQLQTDTIGSPDFDKGNAVFYFKGKIYTVSAQDLRVRELDLSGKAAKRSSRTSLYDTLSQEQEETMEPEEPKPKFSAMDEYYLKKIRTNFLKKYSAWSEVSSSKSRLLSPDETEIALNKNDLVYMPYELEDGESMTLSFTREGGESQIVLKRKGAKTIATRIIDGNVEDADERYRNYVFNQLGSTFNVYNNVLQIRSRVASSVTIDKNAQGKMDQIEESNKGKEFISTNITLDYGGEVWRDPRRILLDAVQNHIDAQGNRAPDVFYSVVGAEDTIERVSKEELQERDETWKIIGVEIRDEGAGYPTPYLTRLGTSTKGDQDRGKYGEGLKMLAASAVHQGIVVEASSRDWTARPTRYTQNVKDYETGKVKTFEFLGYDMEWQEDARAGSSTKFSLLPEGVSSGILTAEQRAELAAKLDAGSPSGKIWQSWVDVLDPRNVDRFGQCGLDRFVLSEEATRPTNGIVTVLPDHGGSIYEKGLLIPREATEPMLFGYNIDETIIDTRERNAFNQKLLDRYLGDYFKNLTDTDVMRQILELTKEKPEMRFYEYKFIQKAYEASDMTKALWRKTYFEVFGNDAVLSLRPIQPKIQREVMFYWRRGRAQERQIEQKERKQRISINSAVAIEEHVPTLQVLPFELTSFFADQVYTSREFRDVLEGSEIEISTEEKGKLLGLIRTTNQMILTMLESLDSNAGSKGYLAKAVTQEELARRKEELRQIRPENIRIKHPSWPSLGMVDEVNGEPVTYLNQDILTRPAETIAVYVHEASHYLSGQKDFVLNFQRFMMALALSRAIPAQY